MIQYTMSTHNAITPEELERLKKDAAQHHKQKKYVKKYHLSEKGKKAKQKAQRKYRAKKKSRT